jgi:hypothetical protein
LIYGPFFKIGRAEIFSAWLGDRLRARGRPEGFKPPTPPWPRRSKIIAMGDDKDQLRESRAEEHERHVRAIERQIDEIRPAYAQALTSLWLGNAGASLAVLSFIGASWRDGRFPHFLLIPLACFVLGLVSMGIGTALWLWGARESIRDTEDAESILDRRAFRAMRPSERARPHMERQAHTGVATVGRVVRLGMRGRAYWACACEISGGKDMKTLTVEDRLGFARAAVAVLRSLIATDRTLHYKELAIAIGLMRAGEKWEAWHRSQISEILDLTAAAEHQGSSASTLEFERVVRQDGQPGSGVHKFSRIVSE